MKTDNETINHRAASTLEVLPAEPPLPAVVENPQPDAEDSKPQGPQRKRNGQVATSPKETRARINEMLDDGLSYPEIKKQLGPAGESITARAIMSWKKGGYKDYLQQQLIIARCNARLEFTLKLLGNSDPISGFQATQQLASLQICEAVADVGADILKEALAANPMNYFRMLNSFSRLTNGGLKCERFVVEAAERKADTEKAAKPGKKGMTDGSVTEMRDKLKLM